MWRFSLTILIFFSCLAVPETGLAASGSSTLTCSWQNFSFNGCRLQGSLPPNNATVFSVYLQGPPTGSNITFYWLRLQHLGLQDATDMIDSTVYHDAAAPVMAFKGESVTTPSWNAGINGRPNDPSAPWSLQMNVSITWNAPDPTPPPPPPPPPPPRGMLNFVDGMLDPPLVYGWALDPTDAHASIPVVVHYNSPSGPGPAVTAAVPRPDVNVMTGYPGDHGFEESLVAYDPPQTIWVTAGSNSVVLTGSGQMFRPPEPAEVWADVNGDGKADYCRFVWTPDTLPKGKVSCRLSTGAGFGVTVESGLLDIGQAKGRAWADVNGDGKADFCQRTWDNRLSCTLSSGNGFDGGTITSEVLDMGYDDGIAWVDFNGDGKADYCRVGGNSSKAFVMCTLSTGTGFGPTYYSPSLDWGYSKGRAWVDFNGDGKADFCRVGGDSTKGFVMCTVSTGTGFGPTYYSPSLDWGYNEGRAWVDFNGDGKADYCRVGRDSTKGFVMCTASTATGFGPTYYSPSLDWGYNEGRSWVDFNGDGKADYCRVGGNSSKAFVMCTLSTGTGFGPTYYSGSLDPGFDFPHSRAWVDITGDKNADFCRQIAGWQIGCSTSAGAAIDVLDFSTPVSQRR